MTSLPVFPKRRNLRAVHPCTLRHFGRFNRGICALCLWLVLLSATALIVPCKEAQAASQWILVTILHTNDIHGCVMPKNGLGGLARAATLIKQARSQMPNVIVLDAGDIIHGTPEDYLSQGLASISAMNAARYDAATTGNHEYDFGLDVLEKAISAATFPFLAANVRSVAGDNWNGVVPYVILTVNGVKVGVVGLTTLETISLHWPGSIKDIRVEDPLETAKQVVPAVRELVDVLVVLSHLGAELDRQLASEVPGIDFIVGGHSHTVIDRWEWVSDTLITQTGAYCRALGRIDFIVRKKSDGKAEIWSVNGKNRCWNDLSRRPLGITYPNGPLLSVDDSIKEDDDIRKAYLPFRRWVDRWLSVQVGYAEDDIPGRQSGQEESQSANLIADAVREFANCDVAIIDANSIGSRGLAKGPIRVGQLYDLIGGYTRQHIVVARIRGKELARAIEQGFSRKGGVNIGVSGASIQCRWIDGALRVQSMKIGGAELDAEKYYTLAAQAYVMMDIMNVAQDVAVVSEPRETTREALVNYFRAHRHLAAPERGRISIVQ